MLKKYGHRKTRLDECSNIEFVLERAMRFWGKPLPLKTKIWLRILYKYDDIAYKIKRPFILKKYNLNAHNKFK